MSQSRPFQVVLVVLALCVATALAGSVKDPFAKAERLLALVNIIDNRARPTVDDVVEAYKEYRRLYEIQTDLSSGLGSVNGKEVTLEDKYKQIKQVLELPALETINEVLFAPFTEMDAKKAVRGDLLRKKIESAINKLSDQ